VGEQRTGPQSPEGCERVEDESGFTQTRKGKREDSTSCIPRPDEWGFYMSNRQETVRVSTESNNECAGI
jgi:hypothetical protein